MAETTLGTEAGAGDGGSERATSLPVPGAAPRIRKKFARLSPEKLETVARMAVTGSTPKLIAAAIDWSPAALARALQHHGPLHSRMDQLRGEMARGAADHTIEMAQMMPQARETLRTGLEKAHIDTRINLAKWLHETLVAKPAQRHEVDAHVSGTLNHDLSGVMEKIGDSLAALRKANEGRSGLDRVKTGKDALYRPALPETIEAGDDGPRDA